MVFLNFLNIFAFFLEFSIVRRVERNETIIFIFSFFQPFQTILAWKEAITGLFNFLKIFTIFLEFSITRWVGTKRNDIFYFLYFSTFSNLFLLERKPQRYFFIFLNFLLFFLNFLLPVRSEGYVKKIFIFLIFGLSQPILAWNEPIMVFF